MKFFKEIPEEDNADKNPPFEGVVEKKQNLGQGFFGKVYRVNIEKNNPVGRRSRKAEFALKEYHPDDEYPEMTINDTTHAFANYKILKKAGIKTFRTYRISEDKKSILMTLKETDGWYIFDPSESQIVEYLDITKRSEILNFDNFIEDIINNIKLLNLNNITIDKDCPFFLVKEKNEKLEVDFIIADVDLIEQHQNIEKNKQVFIDALERFIRKIISNEETAKLYIEKMKERIIKL